MPRRLRYLPEGGALVEITCRTIQSRLLMTPSQETNVLIAGILGRAQRLYKMKVCAFVFMSNHFHLLLDVEDSRQLARFMGYVSGNIAREIGRRIEWREKFWSRRYQSIQVSDEQEAQVARLRYILLHGLKERLVSRPQEWPGLHCVESLISGRPIPGVWFNRTKMYNAQRFGKIVSEDDFAEDEVLVLSPLPCWKHLSPRRYRQAIASLLEEVDEIGEAMGLSKKTVLGVSAILRQDAHHAPRSTKRSSPPHFHTWTLEALNRLKGAYSQFVSEYRRAAAALRRGLRHVSFPTGCFPPALPFEAPVKTG